MKYKSGEYALMKFDKYGSKESTKTFKNYLTAKHKLDEYTSENKDCSGVITRVLFNSADINDKWSYSK